jgi:TonB family protein
MEALGLYLFKSAVWTTGFVLVYLLFLRNERFFFYNRIYLLAGILTSFLLPLVTVHYVIEVPVLQAGTSGGVVSGAAKVTGAGNGQWYAILFSTWLAGVIFIIVRNTVQVIRVLRAAGMHEEISPLSVRLVRSPEFTTPFSLFSLVVVNPSASEIETREIINHEMVHIRQKHWFDLMLSGLLCTVQWFNPAAWIYSRFVRQNHEYLADEGALQSTSDPALYKAALLNQIAGSPVINLGNFFSFSLNKKRFTMMKNKISPPYRKLRLLLILPVVALVLYAFARPEYRINADNTATNPSSTLMTVQQNMVKGTVVDADGTPLPGAAIVVKGTTTGTITDADGKFVLRDLNQDAVLVVSFVGFETKAVKVAFGSDINVRMMKKTIVTDTVTVPPPPPPPPPPPVSSGQEVPPPPPPPPPSGSDDEKFVVIEEMPQFPGGAEAMMSWIMDNTKYPAEAVKNKISGIVYVAFTVSKTGKVQNVKIERSVNLLLDAEALRVIKNMPDWKPGKQHGKSVDVEYKVPVQFTLKGERIVK